MTDHIQRANKYFNIKANSVNEEEHTVVFRISDGKVDRQGEIVDQKSWDFTDYKKNPIMIVNHEASDIRNAIGKCLDLWYDAADDATYGKFQLAVKVSDLAKLAWGLIVEGVISTVSVGFYSKRTEYADDDTPILMDNVLLETSLVVVPANPRAIVRSLKDGSISRKDAIWLMKSMRSEAEYLEEQLKNSPEATETTQMDEASKKQLEALMSAVTTLAKSVNTITEKLDAKETVTKGAVAEIAAIDDQWELEDEKWELMAPVSNFYYALQEAWYYSATPVEAFDDLVREFVSLVSGALDGNAEKQLPTDERLVKALENVKELDVKALTQKALKIETKTADEDAAAAQAAAKAAEDEAKAQADAEAKAADEAAQKAQEEAAGPKDENQTTDAEAKPADDKANEDAADKSDESDAAKDGEIDQSGAVTDQFDLDAELTPELQAQIDSALEQTLTTTAA